MITHDEVQQVTDDEIRALHDEAAHRYTGLLCDVESSASSIGEILSWGLVLYYCSIALGQRRARTPRSVERCRARCAQIIHNRNRNRRASA